ncbi:hypothetical protein [Hymenobacter sediminicola]|uniref:Uncharacterized protein n=1 Tax=Hymenobacter sediminicola TaxID=2761579 RepID=A0A7G7W8T0_9BACT|nr:hypothetical protein [Hymenobacter sediminicola]QNH62773.1 hypothetical protein H4317_02835 [Hymenobacter sediminicola]
MHLPAGFYEAVSKQLEWCSSQPQRWKRLPTITTENLEEWQLLGWLYEQFGLEEHDFIHDKSNAHLCCQPGFRGCRLLLRNLSLPAVRLWSNFLENYQHELKDQEQINRTTFLLLLEGEAATLAPTANTNLLVHSYGSQIAFDDLKLFMRFANLDTLQPMQPLLQQLRQAIASALAPTDPLLAISLVNQPLATLLNPTSFLRQVAEKRGWQSQPLALQTPEPPPEIALKLWYTGEWATLEERSCLHPGLLALHERYDYIQSRIWEGQLKIILPFLEQRRHHLLELYREDLNNLLPHTKPLGKTHTVQINDVAELELGDLFYLRTKPELSKYGNVLVEELKLLRHCRVELAHQRPIDENAINQLLALIESS